MIEKRQIIALEQSVPFRPVMPSGWERHANEACSVLRGTSADTTSDEEYLYLTTRQVPSCMAICGVGTRINASVDLPILQEMGFPLLRKTTDGMWYSIPTAAPTDSAISGRQVDYLSQLLRDQEEYNRQFDDNFTELAEDEVLEADLAPDDIDDEDWTRVYRFSYNDPFRVNVMASVREARGKPPRVLCWPGGVMRLQDNIPVRALGPQWDGNPKRGVPFFKIASLDVKVHVLLNHTHWGKTLVRMVSDRSDECHQFARKLKRRIISFLSGMHNPSWPRRLVQEVYGSDYQPRRGRERALRFLQVLRTVDGMFAQIYLADIAAGWSWPMFDRFVLRNIYLLLEDEFLDGEVENLDIPTHYEALKAYRGELKEATLRKKKLPLPRHAITACFANAVEVLNGMDESDIKIQRLSIIVQTRGCGTPPPLVVLKSKVKFLETISEEEVFDKEKAFLCRVLVNRVINQIPDYVFTGLVTKASVRVTAAACYERNRSEGGTAEFIRTLVNEGEWGRKVRVFDLSDPRGTDSLKELSECTHGEYIFWRCLEEVLATEPEELRKAFVVMVKEPGKARTVTKASAALKIVLDLVNGICSYPLTKVGSSSSGMSKANHGWNFFKEFYSSWKEVAFRPHKVDVRAGPNLVDSVRVTEFEHLYVSFTDYSEATDQMLHKTYAAPVAELWMTKCGIPKFLRGIVHETCFKPRRIEFQAHGCLSKIGHPTDTDGIRWVTLRRGVLMGDPLTKVLLHLLNMGAREAARLGLDTTALDAHPEYGEVIRPIVRTYFAG